MALENIFVKSETPSTTQPEISWLNTVACQNILDISVAPLTSQEFKGELKALLKENMSEKSETIPVVQPLIFWLKAFAPLNMPLIFCTLLTSQDEMF